MAIVNDKYILELERLRQNLVNVLKEKGLIVDANETLNNLIPLVNDNLFKDNQLSLLAENKVDYYKDIQTTNICQYSFYYKTSIIKAYLPNVRTIDARAFNYCTNLRYIYLPNLVELKGIFNTSGGTFCNTNIENLILPNYSISSFNNNNYCDYFYGMSKLKRLIIPKSPLLYNATYNFEILDCNLAGTNFKALNLKTLVMRGYKDSILSLSNSSNISNIAEIYVPNSQLENFKVDTNWAVYADKFKALEGSKYESLTWYENEDWYKEEMAVWQ